MGILRKQKVCNCPKEYVEELAGIIESEEDPFTIYPVHTLDDLPSSGFDPFNDSTIQLPADETEKRVGMYWGSRGSNNEIGGALEWIPINGIIYGNNEENNRLEGADEYDYLVLKHEIPAKIENISETSLFPNYNASTYNLGFELNNLAFLHSVVVKEIQNKKIYTSIIGRKNYLYTEQLDPDMFNVDLSDFTLDQIIGGTNINFDTLLQSSYEIVSNTFYQSFPEPILYTGGWGDYFGEYQFTEAGYIQDWIDGYYNDILSSNFSQHSNIVDAPIWNFSFFKDYIMRMVNFPVQAYVERDCWKWNKYSSFSGNYGIFYLDYMSYMDYASTYWPDYDNLYFQTSWNNYLSLSGRINYEKLFSENWIKSIMKYVYQYVFQTEIDYEPSFVLSGFRVDLQIATGFIETDNWWEGGTPDAYLDPYILQIPETDITESIVSRINEIPYDFAEINTIQDWINNFYVYMDNVQEAIGRTMYEEFLPLITYIYSDYNETIGVDTHLGYLTQLSAYEGVENNVVDDFNNIVASLVTGDEITTDGILYKPSDIVMNILTNEMQFGNYYLDQEVGNQPLSPDYRRYNIDSIEESRASHSGWKMGFSIDKKTNGKKLIENILSESKSYPRFASDGTFGLITIKESYTFNEIDRFVDINEVLKYNFSQTKREDLITSVKMFYKWDYGFGKNIAFIERSVDELLPDYATTGYANYNIVKVDGHRDINLKYHQDKTTVYDYANYVLLNNCNVHLEVSLSLTLNYVNLEVGDVIKLPLIDNKKIFDLDYSQVSYLNSQPIYPMFIVMETNLGLKDVKIKAVQLHYLGTDGEHGYIEE